MPLIKGKGKKKVNQNTKKLISEGYPPKQAYAISKDVERRSNNGQKSRKKAKSISKKDRTKTAKR